MPSPEPTSEDIPVQDHDVAAVLRVTSFRRLWLALSGSSLGDWLGLLATTALAKELGSGGGDSYAGANLAVAAVLILRLAPAVVLGPVAGVIADRLDRKFVMVTGDVLRGLLFMTIPIVGTLEWLFVATLLIECLAVFWIPAKEATVPNLVPRNRLEAANQMSLVTTYGTAPVAAPLSLPSAVVIAFASTGSARLPRVIVSDGGSTVGVEEGAERGRIGHLVPLRHRRAELGEAATHVQLVLCDRERFGTRMHSHPGIGECGQHVLRHVLVVEGDDVDLAREGEHRRGVGVVAHRGRGDPGRRALGLGEHPDLDPHGHGRRHHHARQLASPDDPDSHAFSGSLKGRRIEWNPPSPRLSGRQERRSRWGGRRGCALSSASSRGSASSADSASSSISASSTC